jgi:hypothetical protein
MSSIEEFCRSLSQHRGHADLQHRGCRCLSHYSASIVSPDQRVADLLAVEIVQFILGALVSHKPNHHLVADLLRLLSILGTHAQIRLQISRMKGVKRILSAMDRFPHNLHVQEAGCAVLSTLAVSCDISMEIQTAGGANRVLASMDNHKLCANIQVCVRVSVCPCVCVSMIVCFCVCVCVCARANRHCVHY